MSLNLKTVSSVLLVYILRMYIITVSTDNSLITYFTRVEVVIVVSTSVLWISECYWNVRSPEKSKFISIFTWLKRSLELELNTVSSTVYIKRVKKKKIIVICFSDSAVYDARVEVNRSNTKIDLINYKILW